MPKDRDEYTPAALSACLDTLGTLVKAAGAQHDARLVVVGGLVPRLLMDETTLDPLFTGDSHAGTSDVDLCIELDLSSGENDFYQYLETILRRYRFDRVQRERVRSRWSWSRRVGDVTVIVDLLCNEDSVGVAQAGRLTTDQSSRPNDEIGAFRIRGAHLAFLDPVAREIAVELLDGGGRSKVTVRVASLLAFVVLKSFALQGRIEPKDAYDLVWALTRWNGGATAAAQHARSCSGANHEDVAEALRILGDEFESVEHSGCANYAEFSMKLAAESTANARMKHRRDAYNTISTFLLSWRS